MKAEFSTKIIQNGLEDDFAENKKNSILDLMAKSRETVELTQKISYFSKWLETLLHRHLKAISPNHD
jgi:hypothetical protein